MGEQQHMTEGKNSANRSWVVFDSCTLEVMWDHRGHLAETYWYMLQVHKIVVRDREKKKDVTDKNLHLVLAWKAKIRKLHTVFGQN